MGKCCNEQGANFAKEEILMLGGWTPWPSGYTPAAEALL